MHRATVTLKHLDVRPVVAAEPRDDFFKPGALEAFVADAEWAGKPFWMLQIFKVRSQPMLEKYGQALSQLHQSIGVRRILSGACRTIIGKNAYDMLSISEYPSPEAFLHLATSDVYRNDCKELRVAAIDSAYIIPITPGWFNLGRAAPAPSRSIKTFTVANVWSTASGLVGPAAAGSRVGETSSTKEQAEAFVEDARLGGGQTLWHLNLLAFREGSGRETYSGYSRAMGGKSGTLSLFGARSTLASKCWRSLSSDGEVDFNEAIIAEYPSRDAYLSMASSDEYLKTAHFRHQGLKDTYIISCLPAFIEKS